MRELGPGDVAEYLLHKGWLGPGPFMVQPLGWGVSNVVYRVETPAGAVVLKQSRGQLRTREAWFSDLSRIFREQEVLQTLFPLLPPPTVPEVLFVDRDNYVLIMRHAPPGCRVWKEALLAGETDAGLAEWVGVILGRMHQATAERAASLDFLAQRRVFVQLRVEPFYHRVAERRPEVAEPVARLVERLLSVRLALCHGDYSPKNILFRGHEFTLVDYETGHLGDPAMDLGFFLSHLVLKGLARKPRQRDYWELTRAFWRGYWSEARFQPREQLLPWGIAHFGLCVLARVDGTSPVDYLGPVEKEQARKLGRAILLQASTEWEEVLAECERAIS